MRHRTFAALVLLATATGAACGGGTSSFTGPSAVPTNVSGPYRLQFTPSPVCTNWPAGPLAFDADLTQTGERWAANLPGVLSHDVYGTVAGSSMAITAYVLTLDQATDCWITIMGSGSGTLVAGTASGTFDGSLEAECPRTDRVLCRATNHTFTLRPR